MKKSITTIAVKCVEEILQKIEETDFSSIGQATEELFETLKDSTLELVQSVVEEMDEALVTEAKRQRKIDGITVKERNVKRTVLTSIGELTYERTYFSLRDGTKVYLIDHVIGVESYERITKELCADLLNKATDMSLQKAIDTRGTAISRQTLDNRLLAMISPVTEITRLDNTPKEIHIFADEDHVNIRPKKNAVVPLVTVTEGIDTSNEKRHKTISPISFQGYGMRNECFTENVVAAIYERYDMEKVSRTVIHADGGGWIRSLGDLIPESVYVMDGFHLQKYMKKLYSLPGALQYAGVMNKAITENDHEAFTKYSERIKEKQDEKRIKKFKTGPFIRTAIVDYSAIYNIYQIAGKPYPMKEIRDMSESFLLSDVCGEILSDTAASESSELAVKTSEDNNPEDHKMTQEAIKKLKHYYETKELISGEKDISFTCYADRYIYMGGNISDGVLSLTSEVYGDDYDSERHYIFTKEETEKLFSIVTLDEFIELGKEGHCSGLESFLSAHGIRFDTMTI